MLDWPLMSALLLLALAAVLFAVYPLRKQPALSLMILLFSLLGIGFAYWQWGGFSDWQGYLQQQAHQKQVAEIIQSANGPQAIIERLKAKLKEEPDSAKGWYLLGRIYSSQGDWSKASKAFSQAHLLEPENEQYTVYYAQGLWQKNQQQFNQQIRELFQQMLKKNPNQPDALAMLAMDAFMSHAYNDAINYWQRLLAMAPPDSEEALALRKAIAQAQEKIKQGK